MKKLLIIISVLFLTACSQQNDAKDLIVVSEKPFAAAPTYKMLYEDCKKAIELYENKDPNYAMTACISDIRGSFATSYFYGVYQQIKDDNAFSKCNNKILNNNFGNNSIKVMLKKYPLNIAYAKLIIILYEKKIKSNAKKENTAADFYKGLVSIYYDEMTHCPEIKNIDPHKNFNN